MNISNEIKRKIEPFIWEDFSICLNVGEYLKEVFDTRADEGFAGNGYDWESLAKVYIEEKCPDLFEELEFDSEADMFCVYSDSLEALKTFICGFKETCEDRDLIMEMFSRAELE